MPELQWQHSMDAYQCLNGISVWLWILEPELEFDQAWRKAVQLLVTAGRGGYPDGDTRVE